MIFQIDGGCVHIERGEHQGSQVKERQDKTGALLTFLFPFTGAPSLVRPTEISQRKFLLNKTSGSQWELLR